MSKTRDSQKQVLPDAIIFCLIGLVENVTSTELKFTFYLIILVFKSK